MERICGECTNYLHGQTENPCAKGNRYVGYLQQNKTCWEKTKGEVNEDSVTKICAKCGKAQPIKLFYKTKRTKDKLSNVCKVCKPYEGKRKRKNI